MEGQGECEEKTLVITNETNFDNIIANFDKINGQYDVVKISNMKIDDALAKQLFQKSLNIDLIRLEIDGCTFSPRILKRILERSILDLVFTNCELHLQDICDVMDAFNGSGNHNVDFSKSKIDWDENFNIFDKVSPPSMYEYYKTGSLCFDGSALSNRDKKRLKNKCLGWDLRFIN